MFIFGFYQQDSYSMQQQKFQDCPVDVLTLIIPLLGWKSIYALKKTCSHFYNSIHGIGITDIYVYDSTHKLASDKWLYNSPDSSDCIQVNSKKVSYLVDYFEENPEQIRYVKSLTIDCEYRRSIGVLLDLFENLGQLEKIFFYNGLSYLILKAFGDISLVTNEYSSFMNPKTYRSVYTSRIIAEPSVRRIQYSDCKICNIAVYSDSDSYRKPNAPEFICNSCSMKEFPNLSIQQTMEKEAKNYNLKSLQIKCLMETSIFTGNNFQDLEISCNFPKNLTSTTDYFENLSSITIRNAESIEILPRFTHVTNLKSISIAIKSTGGDIKFLETFSNSSIEKLEVFDLHVYAGESPLTAINIRTFVNVFKSISSMPNMKKFKIHEHFSTDTLNKSLLSCLIYSSPFFRNKQTSSQLTYLELDSSNIGSCLKRQIDEDNMLPDYPIFYWIKKVKGLKTLCIRDIFGLRKISESITSKVINNDPVISQVAELNAFPLFKYTSDDNLLDFIPTLLTIAKLLPTLEILNTGGVFIHIIRNKTVEFKIVGYTHL